MGGNGRKWEIMKAIKFKEHNIVFGEHQEEYLPLPAHLDKEGVATSCWELSFKEKIRVLISGKLFLQIMTFDKSLQPVNIMVKNPVEDE